MNSFYPTLMADFKVTSLLKGMIKFAQDIGGYVVILAGIILLIVGVVQIVKGLAGGGKGQTNWVMSIGCLVVGGALMFGGWSLVSQLANAGGGAIQEMNESGQGNAKDSWDPNKRDGLKEGGNKDWVDN